MCNRGVIRKKATLAPATKTPMPRLHIWYSQGGHFPVSIKFPDLLFSQEWHRIFKGGAQNTLLALASRKFFLSDFLIGVQNPRFEPPIWDTYATVKATK